MDEQGERIAQLLAIFGIRPDDAWEIIHRIAFADFTIDEARAVVEEFAAAIGWPSIDADQAEDSFTITFKRGGL